MVNFAADRLSRMSDSTDWSLSNVAFHRLEAAHGPHRVDLFTSQLNRKCGRYFSATADPGTAGVAALSHDWVKENCGANPPFQLMGLVVDKLLRTSAQATLVAPVWQAQPWWHQAAAGCTSWEVPPAHEGVITHRSRSKPAPAPKWRVAAFRFGDPDTASRD